MAVRGWLTSVLLAALHVTVSADESRPDASLLKRVAVTITVPTWNSTTDQPPVQVSKTTLHTDKSEGPFLGGEPNPDFVDLPITLAFLGLFPLGAITHLSIYRRNAKRGHKFRFSSTVFEFCLVRTATCLVRIAWMFFKADAIILAALILQTGGASILYVIGIFFVERLIRAMHPTFGWTSSFHIFTIFLVVTVLVNGLMNSVSLCVAFLSADDPARYSAAMTFKRTGALYNMMLVLYPLLPLYVASWIPGPPIERFGHGPFKVKVAILVTGIALLSVGAAVRLAETFCYIQPDTEDEHLLYSKPVFYTTHFVLEMLLVILYAVARIDLRFHVPDGCTGPGDYSHDEKWHLTKDEIAGLLQDVGIPHEIISSSGNRAGGSSIDRDGLVAVFYAGAANRQQPSGAPSASAPRRDSISTKDSSIHGPIVGRKRPPPRPPRPPAMSLLRSIMAPIKGLAKRGSDWRKSSSSPAPDLAPPTVVTAPAMTRE